MSDPHIMDGYEKTEGIQTNPMPPEKENKKPKHAPLPDYLKTYPGLFFGGAWARLVAWLIDVLVAKALVRILVDTPLSWAGYVWETQGLQLHMVLGGLVFYAYFVLMSYYNRGQTLGKTILGLRVVSQDGEPLGIGQVLVRECFCRYLIVKFGILSLFIVFHPQKRSLADLFADTYVLSEKALNARAFGKEEAQQTSL